MVELNLGRKSIVFLAGTSEGGTDFKNSQVLDRDLILNLTDRTDDADMLTFNTSKSLLSSSFWKTTLG